LNGLRPITVVVAFFPADTDQPYCAVVVAFFPADTDQPYCAVNPKSAVTGAEVWTCVITASKGPEGSVGEQVRPRVDRPVMHRGCPRCVVDSAGQIFLATGNAIHISAPPARCPLQVYSVFSEDHGATWSDPVSVENGTTHPGGVPNAYANIAFADELNRLCVIFLVLWLQSREMWRRR
jgi:hypothetical protein